MVSSQQIPLIPRTLYRYSGLTRGRQTGAHSRSQLPRAEARQGTSCIADLTPRSARHHSNARFRILESPRELLEPWPPKVRPNPGKVLHPPNGQAGHAAPKNHHGSDSRAVNNEHRERSEEGRAGQHQETEGHGNIPRSSSRHAPACARSANKEPNRDRKKTQPNREEVISRYAFGVGSGLIFGRVGRKYCVRLFCEGSVA